MCSERLPLSAQQYSPTRYMSVCARVWEGRVGGGGMRVTRTVELHGEPGGGGGGGGQAMRTRTQEGRHAH